MIDLCRKADFGGFKGIVGGEGDREEENASSIWGITLCHVDEIYRSLYKRGKNLPDP
jgi:hypothetical protein